MAMDAGTAFEHLAVELGRVGDILGTQGISDVVKTFDGEPKQFREWAAAIDKYCKLAGLPEIRKKLIALRASTGSVSGFIERYMDANPDSTWAHMRRELAKRFSDVTDTQFALSVLRNIRQKAGENIQVYAERIMSIAEEAFPEGGGLAMERQLIDTFVDGLTNDQSKMKVLRSNPVSLQDAVDLITAEENLRARIALTNHARNSRPDITDYPDQSDTRQNESHRPRNDRQNTQNYPQNGSHQTQNNNHRQPQHNYRQQYDRGTPMEVDHSRPLHCFKCKRVGHTSNRCRIVAAVDQPPIMNRKIICWGCGQEGHVIRDCPNTYRRNGHGRQTNYDQRTRPMNGQNDRRTTGRQMATNQGN